MVTTENQPPFPVHARMNAQPLHCQCVMSP